MAKLERVTAKIFASDAPADKIGQFGSALAGTKLETGDVSTIQALPAYTEGWSSAVVSQRNYPVLQETNGVMKNMTYQTAYIMQNGIPEYDPNTEYYTGSICKGVGNTNQYASLNDENIGNDVTNSQNWKNITPVNYSNITNCLVEIPQRIKWTLNNNVFTLLAGSVVIVSYGTEDLTATYPAGATFLHENWVVVDTQFSNNRFFVWAKNLEDISYTREVAAAYELFFYANLALNSLGNATASNATSGAGAPTTGNRLHYDTTGNTFDFYDSSFVKTQSNLSLPIGLCESTGTNTFNKVNQIFNRIGYVGSTIWLDNNIKGLLSDGINPIDGSFKSLEVTTNSLITYTTNWGTRSVCFGINRSLSTNWVNLDFIYSYKELSELPTITNNSMAYVESTNKWYIANSNNNYTWTEIQFLPLLTFKANNNVLTDFSPKQPFQAVDFDDFVELKNDIDGKWVAKTTEFLSGVTLSNTETTKVSLSNYLPNDGNVYEVLFSMEGSCGTAQYRFESGYGSVFALYAKSIFGQAFTAIVSPARMLNIYSTSLCTGTNKIGLRATSYRKVR